MATSKTSAKRTTTITTTPTCGIPLIDSAVENGSGIAICDDQGEHSYQSLILQAQTVASVLLQGEQDLKERRVAFLIPSSFSYVVAQWGTWLAGGIAVPLCTMHPTPELEYVIDNAEVDIIITHPDFADRLQPIAEARGCRFLLINELSVGMGSEIDTELSAMPNRSLALPHINSNRRAMIVYTSGTTNRPKGVVTTHDNIAAQVSCLIESWGWTRDDSTLLVLPLHHVHGIVAVVCSALWIGATCEMMGQFDAEEVWRRFIKKNYTLFMAVPTIYVKLAKVWDSAAENKQQSMSEACRKMRLMISGSAALPVSVLEKWQGMVGHTFLERYGMTEIGMAISNPLHGERRPGYIGQPLPGVTVRLVDEEGNAITEESIPGEIQIKGANVFQEYWKKPDTTAENFKDGWFCSGDTAVLENGYYRILGRNSVDIIKSGGFKISALEIEEELRKHPAIEECSVVGIENEEWGEQVCAALILHSDQELKLHALKEWCKDRIAVYKIPKAVIYIDELPRNIMGKVTKKDVKKLF
ncbi:MAG: acyl-CoA synthetase [Pseudomonadales bacterium]|nr:acyl-CoA synthetase [Pseudomonadales bacterium]